ncbi:hypothetical protein [Desulfobacter vibrioformis]|uniref:hypothetical protein n=1 Tax=Desulfobacter vibrioformis TaxID=34031 RepID=UPI000559769C|nr:hypothetical protein [Desulfobacter vibrioformis]
MNNQTASSPIVIDTNVPKTANLAVDPMSIPEELIICVQQCVDSIMEVIENGNLVLDNGDEIFNEYRGKLSMSGQPGVGDEFLKWLHYNRYSFPESNRVTITPKDDSYDEFPDHPGLADFDISDRKFVAVANAHHKKPQIMEATDSKWWGWKDALDESGIKVNFLCPDFVKVKYEKKMEK